MKIRRWLESAALAVTALALVALPATNRDAAAQAALQGPDRLVRSADPVPGLYVVVLADRASTDTVDAVATTLASTYGGTITHVYQYALEGFAIETSDASAAALSNDPAVEFVQEAGRFTTSDTQPNPPWGLDRIDQRDRPLNGTYRYGTTGQGVNVFIIDTGIYYSHNDFGGRAALGADVVGGVFPVGVDCHGHGTHVAGTVGGNTYGVAKAVRLFSVRVLNCGGAGNTATIAAGVDYVTFAANQGARPAVANMSLSGPPDAVVDLAVVNSINARVTYVVAAGNAGQLASGFSPARVSQAITVAASDIQDHWAFFSNHGSLVDIIAPGVDVRSAGHTSPSAQATMSGTSMASPHVAGAAARCLQASPGATPAQVTSCVIGAASAGKISGVPGSTVNRLLYALPPPTAPANLQAVTASSTQIQLTWTDAQDETAYEMERRVLPNGPWGILPGLPANTSSFLDYDLVPATSYGYRVRAFNSEGAAYSNEASATTSLPAPSNLAAAALSSTRIRLTWTDNSPNEDGFRVERRANNGAYAQIAAVGPSQTAYEDGAVQPAVTYTYRVRAYRGTVNSLYSNEASATPILPAPSNLAATVLSSTRIRLTWADNSADEDGFDVERRTASGPFVPIAAVPAGQTAYEDGGLPPNTYYAYRVRAFVGSVKSAFSNEASATTLGIPPAPSATDPFGCGASLTPTLRWQAVPFAASYRVTVVDVANPSVPVFETTVNAPPVVVPAGFLQPGRRYQWRVRGRNAANEEGPPSSPLVFATEACRLSIDDRQGPEGTAANGTLGFTVALSEITSLQVSVQYATLDGSAVAGRDYVALPLTTVVFPPGTAQRPVPVTLIRDAMDEYDEDFFVLLSNPTGAVLERDRGRGLIQDDDEPPSLSISDSAVEERTGSNGVMFLTVSLSAVSGKRIEVNYLSADGTGPAAARSGQDYAPAQGRLVFEPEGGTAQSLVVQILGDALDEYNEHFFVDITPSDPTTVSGGDRQGMGTILDDDLPPTLSVPSVSSREGTSGTRPLTFTLELSAVSGKTVDVAYETRDGSANAPADYGHVSGLVRLAPGELQGSVNVEVVGDTDYERAESFFLDLSGNPEDVTLPSPASAEGTILNDDRPCTKISDVPYTIAASGVYCLDRDLARAFREDLDAAITVDADHVVVDLNGFTLQALPDSAGPLPSPGRTRAAGIHAVNRTHVTVKNGTIRGFHRGVFLEGMGDEGGQGHVVEGVNADDNAHEGIVVEGSGSIVRRNRVLRTGGGEGTDENHGIRVTGLRPQVTDNEVTETYGSEDGEGHGIHVDATGAVVERNRLGNTSLVDTPVSGIVLLGTDSLVVGNRLITLDRGIVFVPQATGKYRDNMASGVTLPYVGGGIDAGNNQ